MTATTTIGRITNAYSYETYKDLAINLAENGSSTGTATEEHIAATKINAQRLKRIDKQCELQPALIEAINNFKLKVTWLLMAETWCGDGAQCIPVIAKIANKSPNIDLKIVLRDEHPEIIDQYLTNGSRSIPKLICISNEYHQEIGLWGPRPAKIQQMVNNYKLNHPTASHDEFVNNLHLWYAKDHTNAIQEDFISLLNTWSNKS